MATDRLPPGCHEVILPDIPPEERREMLLGMLKLARGDCRHIRRDIIKVLHKAEEEIAERQMRGEMRRGLS